MSNRPIVILGGGGHASVLVDILKDQGKEIKAIISPDGIGSRKVFAGIQLFRSDSDIEQFSNQNVDLVNAVGMFPRSTIRHDINEKFIRLGYRFATVISKNACVSEFANIHEGVQILNRVVIHSGATINAHTVINTGAIIEHDCTIGTYNFISPGAILCGQVKTDNNVFIGANATVIPNIEINEGAIVAAGAVLSRTLEKNKICYSGKMLIK
ncbi:UNVERIFIED_ORG: sugar O-acyltransferase (sialic acid O-acetyltransferase NeuD family) [Buttiauxella agrestis ATCC 33320]